MSETSAQKLKRITQTIPKFPPWCIPAWNDYCNGMTVTDIARRYEILTRAGNLAHGQVNRWLCKYAEFVASSRQQNHISPHELYRARLENMIRKAVAMQGGEATASIQLRACGLEMDAMKALALLDGIDVDGKRTELTGSVVHRIIFEDVERPDIEDDDAVGTDNGYDGSHNESTDN